jgi:hypothetical protein
MRNWARSNNVPRRCISTVLLLFYLYSTAFGQGPHREHAAYGEAPPDARSFMELFTKLESKLDEAVQAKDQNSLDVLLAPEFQLRSSMNPKSSVSRASWIRQIVASKNIHLSVLDAMEIRAFVGVAVVSFVSSQDVTISDKTQRADYLIIDIWEASHSRWSLSERYLAPALGDDSPVKQLHQ